MKRYPKEFESWWQAYPRKVGKRGAFRQWKQACARIVSGCGKPVSQAAEYLQLRCREFAESPKGQGEFCPHPSTWLCEDRFDDDPAEWYPRAKERGEESASALAAVTPAASPKIEAAPIRKVLERVMNSSPYASIPTIYRGIQFRSRLEAKWAAFFDQCGVPWEYEPFDLNGWIPDFLIAGNVLAEVKPFTEKSDFVDAIHKAHRAFDRKPDRELLLLGVGPIYPPSCPPYVACIGWLGELISGVSRTDNLSSAGLKMLDHVRSRDDCDHWLLDWAVFGKPLNEQHKSYVLCTHCGGWRDRITGIDKPWHKLLRFDGVRECWASAANATQWKAPKA